MFFKISVLKILPKSTGKQTRKETPERDSNTGVFLWIFRNFWKHLFYRTPPEDCFFNVLNTRGVLYKKSVLKNFAKFKRKHLCQRLFLTKSLRRRCFAMIFAKFLRALFKQHNSGRLLLYMYCIYYNSVKYLSLSIRGLLLFS